MRVKMNRNVSRGNSRERPGDTPGLRPYRAFSHKTALELDARDSPYCGGFGMGGGWTLSFDTHADRSKKRNSRAFCCGVSLPALFPQPAGMSFTVLKMGLPAAPLVWRSVNTALPQY